MIVNALVNVSNSNDATGCDRGDSYSATLSANVGYILDVSSISVVMGSTDITSTAFDSTDNSITIANVTGNIKITASARSNLIRNWDFTQSLTDTENNAVATTTATQDSTGLTFSSASKYCDFGAVYQANRTYELDVAEIGTGTGNNRRVLMADTDTNTAYGGGSGLVIKQGSWTMYSGSGWIGITGSTFGGNPAYAYLNGKTLRVYVGTDMIWYMYAKTTGTDDAFVYIGQSSSAMKTYTNGHAYIGGSQDDYVASARFTGFRVYEGDIR